MTFSPNRLVIESAEVMAVELSERGEKWAAQTIAGLLLTIEDYERRESANRYVPNSALRARMLSERWTARTEPESTEVVDKPAPHQELT